MESVNIFTMLQETYGKVFMIKYEWIKVRGFPRFLELYTSESCCTDVVVDGVQCFVPFLFVLLRGIRGPLHTVSTSHSPKDPGSVDKV